MDSLKQALLQPGSPTGSYGVKDAYRRISVRSIGVPRESYEKENRVGLSPESVGMLVKKGFDVLIESGAGANASLPDHMYVTAGGRLVSLEEAWGADCVLKVRIPTMEEVNLLRPGSVLISFVNPAQNKSLLEALQLRKCTVFGMDCIPRLSRAQVFDALSSMANIAGYKSVVEAANHFGRFLGGQMTAAGRTPPAKVLVIGAGVAGLAAIATAKNMGAIVRCFDTRPACKEQVESLGGEFLELKSIELEEGNGGYAKEMSPEFIAAEMALLASQTKEVDIIITTALIPGRPAPRLITQAMVDQMKEGSVTVDLAAELGGNIEPTKPGEIYTSKNGITHIGYMDFPSRLPMQSSKLYSNNITKFFLSLTANDHFVVINEDDDVTRGSLIIKDGQLMWPPPRPIGPPPMAAKRSEPAILKKEALSPFRRTLGTSIAVALGLGTLISFNMLSHDINLLSMITVFALAGTAGYQAVWGVTPSLHTPLMSVTNAISGITVVGGLVLIAKASDSLSYTLAATAVLASCINIFGGFLVTARMLDMFRRPTDPHEHNYLYVIPAVVALSLFSVGKWALNDNPYQLTYLTASLCCIAAIGGLATQKSARYGNAMGMIGIATGIMCTLGLVDMSFRTLTIASILMSSGALCGLIIGKLVQVTELPQTVAAFHSLVGLSAMVSSVAHFNMKPYSPTATTTELAAALIGTFIGGITLTGSLVAFAKLHGLSSSKALHLPGKNWINITAVTAQAISFVLFMSPEIFQSPTRAYGMTLLYFTQAISLFLGWHTVASIGGGDMPVCITVLNSYSGWALVAEGFMLNNLMLTIVGSLIGFSGGILSYIMCVAMNRSLANVLFGGYAIPATSTKGLEMRVSNERPFLQFGFRRFTEKLPQMKLLNFLHRPGKSSSFQDTEWQWLKRNMQSPISLKLPEHTIFMYVSEFTQLPEECLDK